MKPVIHACIALIAFLTSCSTTRTLNLTVVDAQTNRPIAGVRVVEEAQRESMLFPYRDEAGVAGETSAQGTFTLRAVHTSDQWHTSVAFQKPGYFEAGCFYSAPGTVALETRVPRTIDPLGELQAVVPLGSDGNVTIRLLPAPVGEKDLSLYRFGSRLPHYPTH